MGPFVFRHENPILLAHTLSNSNCNFNIFPIKNPLKSTNLFKNVFIGVFLQINVISMYNREEAKQLRKQFWAQFGKRCEIIPELLHRKKKWMLYNTKIGGLDLKFEIDRFDAWVMIEVNAKNEDRRLRIFELLEQYKLILEDGFPDGLEWELCFTRESGEEVARVYVMNREYDIHRQNQWPDIYNFFIDNMLRLEQNFLEIRDLLQEQLKK